MSDFASVVDRTRKAFASISKLEGALLRDPSNVGLQINLAASRKLALKSQDQLLEFAGHQKVEVCNYRLMPIELDQYLLFHVSKSLLEFQQLFTQIYDFLKNGPKTRAQFGAEAFQESALEMAYTYSGSLGAVLLAQSERDFFEGKFDKPIDLLFSVLEADDRVSVRDVAQTCGNAVVKRIHDWSKANFEGGFSTDVRWNRSDGRQLGRVFERRHLERLMYMIGATSDEQVSTDRVEGVLIGGDLNSGSFHFVVPHGQDYRGSLSDDFSGETEMTLGKNYRAVIRVIRTTVYATEKVEMKQELLYLEKLNSSTASISEF